MSKILFKVKPAIQLLTYLAGAAAKNLTFKFGRPFAILDLSVSEFYTFFHFPGRGKGRE